MVNGDKRSCGCLRRDPAAWTKETPRDWSYLVTHGLAAHPLYDTWYGMMVRCHNPRNKAYRNYGARGIEVYEPWRDLAQFIADVEASIGPRPEGKYPSGKPLYTIDRYPDNDGNYEPGNVRWATAAEQNANTRNGLPLKYSECCEDGCTDRAVCRRMCAKHYTRWRRHGRSAAA